MTAEKKPLLILAPLRGVTVKTFRNVFAPLLAECGFTSAISPFIAANPMLKIRNSYLNDIIGENSPSKIKLIPQAIGKHPDAFTVLLKAFRDAGYECADLNCGCPYPMVANKGRGAGIMRHPDVLDAMLEAGCKTLGEGKLSVKTRLGVDSPDELEKLLPVINRYPLSFVTIHARTAKQMYSGTCDINTFSAVSAMCRHPVIYNGDLPCPVSTATHLPQAAGYMIGRGFLKYSATVPSSKELLLQYLDACESECSSKHAAVGRLKELLSYWRGSAPWAGLWDLIKMCRTPDEMRLILPRAGGR